MFQNIADFLISHAQQMDKEMAEMPHTIALFFLIVILLSIYVNTKALRLSATANADLRDALDKQIEYVVSANLQLKETRRLLEETTDANKRLRAVLHNLTSKRRKEVTEEMRLGYVYFVLDRKNQLVKIGYSNNPQHRLSGIQTGNGSELELLLTIRGNTRDESSLHERFQVYHKRGEWFEYSATLQRYIEEMEDQAVEIAGGDNGAA